MRVSARGANKWRKCATCHKLETREFAPPPPEKTHPDHADHDNEMPDQNDTAEDDEMLHDAASLHILESLRELAKKNLPNTITFIPHRMRKRFARVYSSKMNELASHMQRREDTLNRELLNLLVWAMPALTMSEDEASTELHKEHHSRSVGLDQRLAEAERDEWGGLIQKALTKQKDDDERKKRELQPIGGQRAGIPQESEQSNIQSKQWMSDSSEADHDGKPTPGEETTKMIQAKLPRDDLREDWLGRSNNSPGEECWQGWR